MYFNLDHFIHDALLQRCSACAPWPTGGP